MTRSEIASRDFRDMVVAVIRRSDDTMVGGILLKRVEWSGLATQLAMSAVAKQRQCSIKAAENTFRFVPLPRLTTVSVARGQVVKWATKMFGATQWQREEVE